MKIETRLAAAGLAGVVSASGAGAASISEIDLGGPAGRGIEFSGVGPADDITLLVIDANPYLPSGFGVVLDVLRIPAGAALGGVAMVTESAWPGNQAPTTTLTQLPLDSSSATLNLNFARLLVLMHGDAPVQRFDRPLADAASAARYDASAVADWLVLGGASTGALYQSSGHDIAGINTQFGIDLLSRLIDKDTGRVVGRANPPGEPADPDTFFVGDPDASRRFDAGGYLYTYTPGLSNLPLAVAPEPGAGLTLLLAGALVSRRRRRRGEV